jgi:hypothetical protein
VRPWFLDHFAAPGRGFPQEKFGQGEYAYRNGLYVIQSTGRQVRRVPLPLDRAVPPNPRGAFVCELVGRITGRGGWGLACHDGRDDPGHIHFAVRLFHTGQLQVIRRELTDVDTPAGSDISAGTHSAIKRDGFNALRVVVRDRVLEVYVNGVAVRDPIVLERDVPAVHLSLLCWCARARLTVTSEYQSVTVWPAAGIPPLERRGAVRKR